MLKYSFFLTLIFSFTFFTTHSQLLDNYGVNIGTTYSNHLWTIDGESSSLNDTREYPFGFLFFLHGEKKLSNALSINSEFGFMQKGFRETLEILTSSDIENEQREPLPPTQPRLIFHQLALDISLKVKPFQFKFNPYALVGIRGNYRLGFRELVFDSTDPLTANLFSNRIEEYNRFNLGGIVGLGAELNDTYYLELVYNQTLPSEFDDFNTRFQDRSFELKFGVYINQLLNR